MTKAAWLSGCHRRHHCFGKSKTSDRQRIAGTTSVEASFHPGGERTDMRRDPRIINLYDKPLYWRPRFVPRPNHKQEYGSAFLSCLAIMLSATGCFWIYDTVAHRERPFVPL